MKKSFQLAAVVLAAMLGACSGGEEKKAETTAAETVIEKPTVKLATVTSRDVEQLGEYTATVEAEAKNNIAPTAPGRISQIFVEVGDYVRKGQKLVQMDAANLTQLKLQLDNQETEFKRVDELYKVGGASKAEWDAAKTNLDVRRSSYQNLLENTQLVSPLDGVVTARNFDNGDLYSSTQMPVLVVQQITPVKLMVNVSEPNFPRVSKGMPVTVKLDVYEGEEKIYEYCENVELLTYDQWTGLRFMPEFIAAFVTPNHPVINEIVKIGAKYLAQWGKQPLFTGYQTNNPNNVKLQMAAIYAALMESQIVYNNPPAGYEVVGQRVRMPHMVMEAKEGTCLDLTVLYTACLEAVGLNPLIIFVVPYQ